MNDTSAHALSDDSFVQLYREAAGFVARVVRNCGVPVYAVDDAVQDVFMVLHRRRPTLESSGDSRAWLRGVARRVSSNYRRAMTRRLTLFPKPFEDHDRLGSDDDASAQPEELVAQKESIRQLGAVLERLQPERRAVLVLTELEELSAIEISARLQRSPNTVSSLLRLARRDFGCILARMQRPVLVSRTNNSDST